MIKKVINMFESQFKWQVLNNDVQSEEQLINVLFQNRNITTDAEKSQFLSDELSLHDPFLFKDMNKIVNRIKEGIKNQEKIMIYGDFDVDGVTGVAILFKTLKSLNANVSYYLPNRFTEGYGPNKKAFENIVAQGFNLIITVDNGISGILEAQYLKSMGIDLIITDHHEQLSELPEAYGILHPKLSEEKYPFKDLSGCGVAFKLACALLGEIPYSLIDLAGLGTYSDMVMLRDENRSLVKWGLKQMKITQHLGLRLLIQGLKINRLDEYALGFIIGPRLNAPGRMDNGNVAVRLLVTEDLQEARELVNDIESLNSERKAKIDVIINEAIAEIEKNNLDKYNIIIVVKEDWHEGVLGIICNRLVNIYHKPVIVLTESLGMYKGSCRTLEDFPLHENLEKCRDLLDKFGGHKMAAGLTLMKDNLPKLRERLHELAGTHLQNTLKIECGVNESIINLNLTRMLQSFRPFGSGNENPLFLLTDMEVFSIIRMGEELKHLKMVLRKNNHYLDAVAFNFGKYFYNINNHDKINVVGSFEINEYNGTITNQFRIEDLECNHKQIFDYRNRPFDESVYLNKKFMYLYFGNQYQFTDAYPFTSELELKQDVVIVDLPKSMDDFNYILHNPNIKNIYLLLKYDELFSYEHLVTRDKLGRIYQVFRKLKQFKQNDPKLIQMLEKMGFNKLLQKMSIQVFFELNFVIIEDNDIIVLDNPEKRQLTESKTFREMQNEIMIKEKLILSTQEELIKYIYNLMNTEV